MIFFFQFLQDKFPSAATNANVDLATIVPAKCTAYLLFIKWDYVQFKIPTRGSRTRFSE